MEIEEIQKEKTRMEELSSHIFNPPIDTAKLIWKLDELEKTEESEVLRKELMLLWKRQTKEYAGLK